MRKTVTEWALLAGFALFWTGIAWRVWPVWDDAWLWLSFHTLSPDDVQRAHGDRPLFGWLESRMFAAALTRELSAVAHAATWFATGAAAMLLWRRLYPSRRSLGVVAGLIAMSPIFSTTQIVLINPIWSGSLPSILPWAGLVLAWPADEEGRPGASSTLVAVVAAVLTLVGCLLSEYAVSAVLAAAALFAVMGFRNDNAYGRKAWRLGMAAAGLALIGYVLFRSMVHEEVRASVGPRFLLHHLVGRVVSFPFFFATTLWQAVAGTVLTKIGGIRIEQSGMERTTSLAVAVGVAASAAAIRSFRGLQESEVGLVAAARATWIDRHRTEAALVAAVAAGLAPFCLMDRVPLEDASSRYWLPVLPALAALSLSVLRGIVPTEARRFVPAILVGAAAYWSVANAGAALQDRRRVRAWAHELTPCIANGPTLVVFSRSTPWPPYTRDYELTARLRLALPLEHESEHLWAARGIPDAESAMKLLPPAADGSGAPRLTVDWRGAPPVEERLARIVWASVRDDGKLKIVTTDYR